MDAYTIAFGIRNVTHIEKALKEAYRVLKPGGRFLCLEFSRVDAPGLDGLYDRYSFAVLPRLGEMVAGDGDAYRYLVESIRRFPPQAQFAKMIGKAGFGRVEIPQYHGRHCGACIRLEDMKIVSVHVHSTMIIRDVRLRSRVIGCRAPGEARRADPGANMSRVPAIVAKLAARVSSAPRARDNIAASPGVRLARALESIGPSAISSWGRFSPRGPI